MRRSPESDYTEPCRVELEEGRSYYWCACGRSFRQPFCDSSHAGSGFSPRRFRARRSGPVLLCGCKRTRNPPYCDDSHALPAASDA